jgi:hypothetical protein
MNLKTPTSWLLALFVIVLGCQSQQPESASEQLVKSDPCKNCPRFEGRDTLAFVDEVVTFFAKNADTGLLPNAMCDTFYKCRVDQLQVQAYLDQFDKNKGVASCGLVASLVVKVLLDNGIDAYTYSFGFPEVELSHMVVLVKAGDKLLLYDPFINYTLTDDNGVQLSFESVLSKIFEVEPKFKPVQDGIMADLNVDMALIDSVAIMKDASQKCLEWAAGFSQLHGSVYQKKIDRSFIDELNRPCSSFIKRLESKLQAETSLKSFAQAMLIKTHPIIGASDHRKVDSLLNAVITEQANSWEWK